MDGSLLSGESRGIGADIVRKCAAEGCNVAINYMNSKDTAENFADQMRSQYVVKIAVIHGDMARKEDCKALVRKTVEELGGLDILLSNAGNTKFRAFNDIHVLSPDDWGHAWHVTVMAKLWLLQEAKPIFESNADGESLLIMSSAGGLINNGSSLAYSVARATGLALNRCKDQKSASMLYVQGMLGLRGPWSMQVVMARSIAIWLF